MKTLYLRRAAAGAAVILISGCAVPQKPSGTDPQVSYPGAPESAFNTQEDYGNAPDDLIDLSSMADGIDFSTNIEARAVRDAGRRMGATAGYNKHARELFEEVEQYDQYLSKIFNFHSVMLPNGIVPPVIAQTDKVISYNGPKEKEIKARVYRTLKDARLANPRAPSWRDYLNVGQVSVDYPLPQMKSTIEDNRAIWERAVEEGWDKGHQQAKHAFEVGINRLERDLQGMQLFHALWAAEMVEPPQIVENEVNVTGGGAGNSEMAVGVRSVVINEDAYFINDSSRWNAIIASAFSENREAAAGLSDIVQRVDNTGTIPDAVMDSDLRRIDHER